MEPSINPVPTPQDNFVAPYDYRKIIVAIAGVLVVALFGWLVWSHYESSSSSPLHMVSTSPGLAQINTITPSVVVGFNKPITRDGLSISSKPSVVSGYSVKGTSLTISLHIPLQANTTYTITLESVRDTSGGQDQNQTLSFKPQYVAYENLPKGQQKALVQQQQQAQTTQPYSLQSINFTGTDSLLNDGISTEQETDLEQAFFQYGQSVNPHITQVAIDPSSVVQVPPNPNSTTTTLTINFNVALNNATYKAVLDYTNLTSAQLYLYDQSNNLVFNSGLITQ